MYNKTQARPSQGIAFHQIPQRLPCITQETLPFLPSHLFYVQNNHDTVVNTFKTSQLPTLPLTPHSP